MITIEHLTKSFDGKILYEDLSLVIEDGQFVVITGPSGCGKTTLLNLIGGLDDYEKGSIIVDDYDLSKYRDKMRYYRDDVGFLFQNFALVEDKTVRDNLEMIYKKSRSDISIEKALEFVGMSDRIDSKVYKLSGGEQQRIAIARLMVKKCKLILADEPTSALDKENVMKIIGLLCELNKMGKTIVMVTHDTELVQFGTRCIKLNNGKVLSDVNSL